MFEAISNSEYERKIRKHRKELKNNKFYLMKRCTIQFIFRNYSFDSNLYSVHISNDGIKENGKLKLVYNFELNFIEMKQLVFMYVLQTSRPIDIQLNVYI